jgi:hypothetical protein
MFKGKNSLQQSKPISDTPPPAPTKRQNIAPHPTPRPSCCCMPPGLLPMSLRAKHIRILPPHAPLLIHRLNRYTDNIMLVQLYRITQRTRAVDVGLRHGQDVPARACAHPHRGRHGRVQTQGLAHDKVEVLARVYVYVHSFFCYCTQADIEPVGGLGGWN